MSIKYQIWLTYNAEKEKIRLPVLPESFKTVNGSNNESVNITGFGEIVVMQSRPALKFSFSSFFPSAGFPGIQTESITKPLSLIQKINSWKAGKTPVHFIITACGVDIYCIIEDFQYSEEGGDPGTYQYSITLREYRAIEVRKIKMDMKKRTASVLKNETRVDNSVAPRTYMVRSGDCLWNIAKIFYGSGALYTKIYNANRKLIGGNPNRIYPGQVLNIP